MIVMSALVCQPPMALCRRQYLPFGGGYRSALVIHLTIGQTDLENT
jgi:hypothetical protein